MDDQRRVAMVETKWTWVAVGEDPPAFTPGAARWRYQLDDHLGTSVGEVTETGLEIGWEEYHPYGTTALSSFDATREVSTKRYRYTGMERDNETELQYHGHRFYHASVGRWMSPDPIGVRGGPNLFEYSRGRPIKFLDRSGTRPMEGGLPLPAEHSKERRSTARADSDAHYLAFSEGPDMSSAVGTASKRHMVSETTRKLTKEERAVLREVFGRSLNLAKVRIHFEEFIPNTQAITTFNTIHFTGSAKGSLVQTDASGNITPNIQLTTIGVKTLIHEATHVWQYQHGGKGYLSNAAYAQQRSAARQGKFNDRSEAYNWRNRLTSGLPFAKWNAEAQAGAVEDYAWAAHSLKSNSGISEPDWERYTDTLIELRPIIAEVRAGHGGDVPVIPWWD